MRELMGTNGEVKEIFEVAWQTPELDFLVRVELLISWASLSPSFFDP